MFTPVLIMASIMLVMMLVAVMLYLWRPSYGPAGRAPGLFGELFAAQSPPKLSPVKARPRDAYFPNSDDLQLRFCYLQCSAAA